MQILQFIFQDIWHFIGTVILLLIIIPWGRFSLVSVTNK